MNRTNYLADEHVAGFMDWLGRFFAAGEGSLHQSFRARNGRGGRRIELARFCDAVAEYEFDGKDLATTQPVLDGISERLADRVFGRTREDETTREFAVLTASLDALVWGGVTVRPTIDWLSTRAAERELSRCIAEATEALLSDDCEALACFEGDAGHRSDSAATKIYALANPRSTIYDNRVGAAFAKLVVEYLRHRGITTLPDELRFMVGAGRGRRNPSAGQCVFQPKETGLPHARWNQRANWIIGELADNAELAKHLGVKPETPARRAIEAGLFVMGDDVRSLTVESDHVDIERPIASIPEEPEPLEYAGRRPARPETLPSRRG